MLCKSLVIASYHQTHVVSVFYVHQHLRYKNSTPCQGRDNLPRDKLSRDIMSHSLLCFSSLESRSFKKLLFREKKA